MTSKGEATSSRAQAVSPDILKIAERIRASYPNQGALPAERKLADELGVNRYVLRQALQHLRDQGLIAPPRPRAQPRKARSKPDDLVSMTNPLEVAELRRMIEPVFAKLAAMRATPSDIAAMQKELDNGGANGARDIHQLIAQSTGNTLAAELYSLLRRIEEDARLGSAANSRDTSPEDVERRRAIVDAIASRAPDKASAAMSDTLNSFYRANLYGLD
ncbi:MAG: FadR family transcriptional regulator [Rhodobacter sp.]|nr:FadR family transcriptional regulator [Paracoccaceae bacterium]MCC0077034.1 FadR family transcriptional regulator [Rhodobacter sp.]